MKIYENKKLFKKMILFLIIITIFTFCFNGKVSAKGDGPGGVLLKPVISLVLSFGDGILNVLHTVILNQNETLLTVDLTNSVLSVIATIAIFIVSAVIVGAVIYFTGGLAAVALAKFGIELSAIGIGTILMVSTGAGIAGAAVFNSNVLPDDLELPVYSISPEEIFSNKIGILDVDFFNPNENKTYNKGESEKEVSVGSVDGFSNLSTLLTENGISRTVNSSEFESNYSGNTANQVSFTENGTKYKIVREEKTSAGQAAGASPTYTFSLYKYEKTEATATDGTYISIAYKLRSTISNWYNVLRDIAIVALLSVLVYIGIRILISSTSSDKAKYKQMLMDWIIAICLLFVMQYIMSFSNLAVEKLTAVFGELRYDEGYCAVIEDDKGKIEKALTDANYDVSALKYSEDGKDYINWKTNLLGVARLNAQMAKDNSVTYAGWTLIFLVLVFFTLYFFVTYLKRVLYMAFLTIIAPLVALTYPIDKINDGKAQAFNMWFKEYIFNLLIQPMHLLLYTILVSSAFELASNNMIYSLVAIGFMIPAEKLLRKFFGFEKAQTPGLLAGPAGAAITMEAMKHLFGKAPNSRDGKQEIKKGGNEAISDGKQPKVKEKLGEDTLFGDGDDYKQDESIASPVDMSDGEDANNGYDLNDNDTNNAYIGQSDYSGYLDDGYDLNDNNTNNGYIGQSDYSGYSDGAYDRDTYNLSNNNIDNIHKGKSNKKISRYARATKNYTGEMLRNLAQNTVDKIQKSHPVRVAAGLAAGTAFGMIGLAGTITAGDGAKTGQYTLAAATGGYKFGRATSGAIGSSFKNLETDDMKQMYEREKYETDAEYNEALRHENIKNLQNNQKYKFELERKYGKTEAKQIMKNHIPKLVENGITNIDDIKAVEDLIRDDSKETRTITTIDKAIATKNMADRVGNTEKMKGDDVEKWRQTLKKDYDNSEKWKDRDTETMSRDTMEAVRAYNKIRFN